MKKNIMFVVLVLGSIITVSAKSFQNIKETSKIVHVTDEFVKIESSELTPPVVEELLKQYPTSKLGAAYKNDQGEFKLVMVLKSGTRRTVYIDQYGNWINRK